MARGRKKTTTSIHTPLKVALLLSQIALAKIGSIPLYIVYGIWYIGKKIRFPTYSFPHLHRGRGRPRKLPLIPFYLIRLKRFLKQRVSLKVKVSLTVLGILLLVFSYTSFILTAAYQLPTPQRLNSSSQPLTTEIYDRNGQLLYRLYEGQNRSLTKLESLPPYLIQATISSEDKNFFTHSGIDVGAIVRAIYNNRQNGNGHLEGASTITQQLVKNSLLTAEKTYTRKIKEIILSIWAEVIYSKNEILTMYFNTAPYGGPNTGIEAASLTYFGKQPTDLTLAEAAFLAGLPASPTQFSPYGSYPELGLDRQKHILKRMVEDKHITSKQAEEALSQKLTVKPPQEDIKAPHFVFYIKDLLSQKYGPRVVSQGGLKIQTSLDLGLQEEVEKIVKDEIGDLAPLGVNNGAAMITDAKTGQILAMVGSRDYRYPGFGQFNATLALRQPGSSIKVITYATAFKQGYSPGNTVLDIPVTFKDQWGNSYSPVNYDGTSRGPVSIRQALGSSLNVPAVKILATVGVDNMIQTAQDLGITTFNDPARFGLSLTLGGGEVKMIEMMGVYGAFSQMGKLNKPTGILKVTDSSGNVLEEYEDHSKVVIQPEIAYLITNILSDNNARALAFGPNSLLNIPNQVVSVKTGTSDNKRDNLTFGYTKDLVVGVWVGNNDNSPMKDQLTSGITGAAPIWHKIIKGLLAKNPSPGFIRPSGIIEAKIDGRKDLVIADKYPKGLVRVKTEPEKTTYFDAFSSYATPSAVTSLPGNKLQ